jgi:Flp pilus assembly protein TadB
MAIVLFILIAGLWAAFLLPAFFDHRSNAPKSTTRDFARTRKKLAQVSTAQPDGDAYVRRHAQRKRQQILVGLAATFVVTLGYATWAGSVRWLYINIVVAVAIAGYITLLLAIKAQRSVPRAQVVQIAQAPHAATARHVARPPVPEYEESQTVRVIAG